MLKHLISRFERLGFNTKQSLGIGMILLLMFIIGFQAIRSQQVLNDSFESIYENDLLGISHIKEANINLVYMGRALNRMALAQTPEDRQRARDDVFKAKLTLEKELAEGRRRIFREDNLKRLDEFEILFGSYNRNIDQVMAMLADFQQNSAVAFLETPEFNKVINAADDMLTAIAVGKEKGAAEGIELARRAATQTLWVTIAILVLGIVFGGLFGYFISASIKRPSERLQGALQELADGHLAIEVPHTDYPNEIGQLARSVEVLQGTARQMDDQRWVKSHIGELSARLQKVDTFGDLASQMLSVLAPLLGVGHGVFYFFDNAEQKLSLLGSYGYRKRKKLNQAFALGEGLVGQCAFEKKPITLVEPPDDYIRISSGLGEAVPKVISVFPVMHLERVLAVIELAAFRELTPREQGFIDELLPVLAMTMEILERNQHARQLLEETQKQARRMEMQAAQLEEQAVELDAQQAELKQTEAWFRSIIESAPDGMVVFDERGSVILSNPKADAIFGYSEGGVGGLPMISLVPDFVVDADGDLDGNDAAEMNGRHKDGWAFPIEISLARLPALEGHGPSVCASIRDSTIRKQIEDEIRNAKDVAEEATRTKSDFLANMSHEIRTPMNSIIGMAHLALKSELTPRQRDYLKKIQGSSQHLLGIINDVLDFSKIEAGMLSIEYTDFELEKVFDNVANLVAEKATAKGLELIFNIDSTVPRHLNGDSLRLGQILINYANNAVKFTEHGEIIISARVVEEVEQEYLIHFSVRDSGIGLSEEQIKSLFKSFQQADTSTSRKYGGTGLGLAISKQLAHLMHGEVGVESVPDEGSTFWFTARLGLAKSPIKQRLNPPELVGRRALVVDDSEAARDVLEDMLLEMTFDVSKATCGKEAVIAVQQAIKQGNPYDMVFLDWRMPGMDGIDVAKVLKKLNLQPNPGLVMVTAYGREEVLKDIEEANLQEILFKPVNGSALFDTVIRVLGGEREEMRLQVEMEHMSADLSQIRGAQILLAEDNRLNQEVAVGLLDEAEVTISIANNGQEAIELLNTQAFDIVLMDMQMPIKDGVTATIELRRDPRFRDLPIIAMTANAMQQDKEKCSAAGMDDHISKPIDPEQLFSTLIKWLAPRLAQKTAIPAAPPKTVIESGGIPDFAPIAGVDFALGLRRANGKQDLYLKLLRRQAESRENTADELRAALLNGDHETAERLAHTAKGVSGIIGATQVQEMAADIEKMVIERGEPTVLEARIAEFGQVQAAIQAALRLAFQDTAPAQPLGEKPDAARQKVLIAGLTELLENNDGGAADFFESNAAAFGLMFDSAVFGKIGEAISAYDFETALNELVAQAATPNAA